MNYFEPRLFERKYHLGDLIRYHNNDGHWPEKDGLLAVVIEGGDTLVTYTDGSARESYCLWFPGHGKCAWFYDKDMELVKPGHVQEVIARFKTPKLQNTR